MARAAAGEIVYVTVSEQVFRRSVEQLVDIFTGRLRLTLHGLQYLVGYPDVVLHHASPLLIIAMARLFRRASAQALTPASRC
jgi:hypothetical protein